MLSGDKMLRMGSSAEAAEQGFLTFEEDWIVNGFGAPDHSLGYGPNKVQVGYLIPSSMHLTFEFSHYCMLTRFSFFSSGRAPIKARRTPTPDWRGPWTTSLRFV